MKRRFNDGKFVVELDSTKFVIKSKEISNYLEDLPSIEIWCFTFQYINGKLSSIYYDGSSNVFGFYDSEYDNEAEDQDVIFNLYFYNGKIDISISLLYNDNIVKIVIGNENLISLVHQFKLIAHSNLLPWFDYHSI